MPTPTYVAIAKTVLTGNQVTITFSSIPSTYTDLILLCSSRWDGAGYSGSDYRVNGSTTTDSSTELYVYDGTNSGSTRYTTRSQGAFSSGTDTSNTFGSTEIYIPNYAGSTYKVSSVTSVAENNSTTTGLYISLTANLWSATTAMSSLNIVIGSGNFVSGSRFDLYGIKNS